MLALTLTASLLLTAAPTPAEPKELAPIRERYQAAVKAIAEGPFHTIEINPADSSGQATSVMKLVGRDHLDIDADRKQLVFIRSEASWSNLGVHTTELLFDASGELIFHYFSGNLGGGEWANERSYFAKGVLVWVVGDQKGKPPTEAQKAAAEGTKKEGKRVQAMWRQVAGG